MKKDFIILFVLSIIVLGFLAWFFVVALNAEEIEKRDLCKDFGCDEYAQYVGSSESNVFHRCDCRYAETINKENIVCFIDSAEATSQGYREAEVC